MLYLRMRAGWDNIGLHFFTKQVDQNLKYSLRQISIDPTYSCHDIWLWLKFATTKSLCRISSWFLRFYCVREAPMRKFLANSGLVNKDSSTPKVESMDIDANLPSTSNKKSQRATPDGNRKRDRSNKWPQLLRPSARHDHSNCVYKSLSRRDRPRQLWGSCVRM